MVNVAQLVEHQVVALRVVGSIPTIHPILRRSQESYGVIGPSINPWGLSKNSVAKQLKNR